MGKCSRNRAERQQNRNEKQARRAQAAPRIDPLQETAHLIDLKDFKLSDLLGGTPPSGSATGPGTAGANAAYEAGYGASRWNALKAGLRASVLFPAPMQALIDERHRDFAAQRRARSLLDHWLCLEMARATVKIDVAEKLLAVDQERVFDRVENSWDIDGAAAADRLAQKLQDQPYDVARELGRNKYGTLLLISRWESLGHAAVSNQGLDESQIQMAYDLLAVPKVLRNGSREVPPANDVPALLALVGREIAMHRANLQRTLNWTDESEREFARLGLMKARDQITRGLKADRTRAEKRFKWAQETFILIRAGVDPATIIDPATKEPIKPEASAAPVSEPEPASSAPPPTPPAPPETPQESVPECSESEAPLPPLPEGVSGIEAEMYQIFGGVFRTLFEAAGAAQSPSDEHGPVTPG